MGKIEYINKAIYLGYALDAVDISQEIFNVELDFSDKSIKNVEKILGVLCDSLNKVKPSDEDILEYAKKFSAYIGQIIIDKWGGEWKDESEYSIKNGPVLRVGEINVFLLSKVYRRIINGSEDNIELFYERIQLELRKMDKHAKNWYSDMKKLERRVANDNFWMGKKNS